MDGSVWDPELGGWHLGVWSRHATAISVVVIDRARPDHIVWERSLVRKGDRFATFLRRDELDGADLYGLRVDGPRDETAVASGHRFDPHKILCDPYASRVWFPEGHTRRLARVHGASTLGHAPLAVLDPPEGFPRARPLLERVDPAHRVILEVHVRQATMLDNRVPPAERGTYGGLIHRLDEWRDLGVTTLELMPVQTQDPDEGSAWGYMPLVLGALDARLASDRHGDPTPEFVRLVDAAHERGLEVVLDLVANHTTEIDDAGPTYSLRGIDAASYYLRDAQGRLVDDAGCGNVLRAGRLEVGRLVLAAVRRFADWGVDGFRFDLASLLGRDAQGHHQLRSTLLDDLADLARERGLVMIAEPWDLAAYEVGDRFPQREMAQWNDRFRDQLRGWLRAETGLASVITTRLAGSTDLFGTEAALGGMHRSVNFVTAHDGFTLYDLVSYDSKRNEANGHANTDGASENHSWNCGVDGDENVPAEVAELRRRQMRNALGLLLLANGTPMLLAGDETARTQIGNNNPYNHDGPLVWHDPVRAQEWADLRRFVAVVIAWRRACGQLGRLGGWGDAVSWHGAHGPVDLAHHSHSLAAWVRSGYANGAGDVCIITNQFWEPLEFTIPGAPGWHRVIDTMLPAPQDALEPTATRVHDSVTYPCGPRSLVVLWRPGPDR